MRDASEKFHASSYGHDQRTNRKRQYSLSNRPLSRNAETKDFARPTSHPVRGWTGKNKAFCSPGTQNGRRVIKVYSDSALCEAKAICGTTSPRTTVLALFYESVNRLTETKEIEKKKNNNNNNNNTTTKTNWTKELNHKPAKN